MGAAPPVKEFSLYACLPRVPVAVWWLGLSSVWLALGMLRRAFDFV